MATDAQQIVLTRSDSPDAVRARSRAIYQAILDESQYLDGGNFSCIHPHDLQRMFDMYDEQAFGGLCRQQLGSHSLEFRFSKRMTRSGGTTARREYRNRDGQLERIEYEIAVASTLLFQTFSEDHRRVVMSGIECNDRLEALQRVMEHEMTHLVELLLWEKTSCTAARFQSIAQRFFGHTEHTHQLITPRERAWTKFNIRAGDRVSFRVDGKQRVGRVNRITKRATVLVEDPGGERYSDGKCYLKFYVPLPLLQPEHQSDRSR